MPMRVLLLAVHEERMKMHGRQRVGMEICACAGAGMRHQKRTRVPALRRPGRCHCATEVAGQYLIAVHQPAVGKKGLSPQHGGEMQLHSAIFSCHEAGTLLLLHAGHGWKHARAQQGAQQLLLACTGRLSLKDCTSRGRLTRVGCLRLDAYWLLCKA